jgi:glycosyltransferase involved in cell wall biosynthesis
MHILMIAPEPFFEPRGTPFSEFHRIRALTALGHTVDLVTYPFGEDVVMAGLTIHRAPKPPWLSRVGIGPSWAKVPLDVALALSALRLALTRRYDAVHSHEEGGVIGVALAALRGVPHLYDMHSSLPQQVANFGYRAGSWLPTVLGVIERFMVRRSHVVIVICPELEGTVRAITTAVPTVLIENAAGAGGPASPGSGARVRASLACTAETPLVVYTGTFEAYQGLGLLYDAMRTVARRLPAARLVMVGGDASQVARARRDVEALGLGPVVIFTGQRPAAEIPAYLDAATVLVSPRSSGTNTPLKLYQYLRSGRPIVATRLRTHTQVLSDDTAFLVEPTAGAFAGGIVEAITDPARAAAVGRAAVALAESKYTEEAFVERTRSAYALLAGGAAGAGARSPA